MVLLKQTTMPEIQFRTTLYKINDWTILRLPEEASAKLPARGQVMVKGSVNGYNFRSPLEPDGNWSHWLRVDDMAKAAKIKAGDTVNVSVEPIKEWSEPDVPADLLKALKSHPEQQKLWTDITPLARWEWIRWIGSTSKSETRQKRIEVAFSKMMHGERRPCCFNRSMCCVPAVSKSGVLLGPTSESK